jgi:hypothetical protein
MYVTADAHDPIVMFWGTEFQIGLIVSRTTTWKFDVDWFPARSVAVTVTVVVPGVNTDPLATVVVTVAAPQLSTAVIPVQDAIALHCIAVE